MHAILHKCFLAEQVMKDTRNYDGCHINQVRKLFWKLDLKDILGCTTNYLKQTVLKSASYVKNKRVQS